MTVNQATVVALACGILGTSAVTHKPEQYPHSVESYKSWYKESVQENYRRNTRATTTFVESVNQHNPLMEYYQHEATHKYVIDFFVRLTGSEEIALPILFHAEEYNLPLDLFFSLAWVESHFRPRARNFNATTVDRGLFQLNSASFWYLEEREVYNPEINTSHAARHMRYCLRHAAGDVATALAIYNAGLGRVRTGSIPQSTRVYISRILSYRAQLVRRFNYYLEQRIADETSPGPS